jgi:hypothetical protein
MTRSFLLAATASLLAIAMLPAAVGDTAAVSCTGLWTWRFWPPLSANSNNGWNHTDGFNACGAAAAPCPGLISCAAVGAGDGWFEGPFVGDCIHATIYATNGWVVQVFGGSAFAATYSGGGIDGQASGAIVSLDSAGDPCWMSTGTSVATISAEQV